MPPEQARGEIERLNERSDVFGLGAILCEILIGEPPYSGVDRLELLSRAKGGDLAAAYQRLDASGADTDLIAIVKHCLAADPVLRPHDAGILAAEVAKYLESVEARLRQAELERARAEVQVREARRRMKFVLAAAILALILVTGGAGAWYVRQSELAQRLVQTQESVNLAVGKAEQLRAQAASMPLATSREVQDAIAIWKQAQGAVDEAEGALTIGLADDALRDRVQKIRQEMEAAHAQADRELKQLQREEKLFRDLDGAQMARLATVDNKFDYAGAAKRYTEAFSAYDLPLNPGRKMDLAGAIDTQKPAVRDALIVGLDIWANCAEHAGTAMSVFSADELRELAQTVDRDAWRNRFREAKRNKDLAGLQATANEARQQKLPPSSLHLLALGLASVDRGASVDLLRWARSEHPTDFWLHLQLGTFLSKATGDSELELEEAVGCFRTAVALRPAAAAAHNNLGAALAARQQFDEAIAEYRKAIEIDPKYAMCHCNFGNALADLNRLDEAIVQYRKAIEIDPHYANAHYNLGTVLQATRDFEGAIAEYRKAIEMATYRDITEIDSSAMAYVNLGNALDAKGDWNEAMAAYRQAVEIDPKLFMAHFNLGNALLREKQLDEAIAEYRQAIEIDPANAHAHNNLGNAVKAKNHLDEAIAEYRQAIELDSNYVPAHLNLGHALRDKNRLDEAIAEFRQAIEIDPRSAPAHDSLGGALADKGELDNAISEFHEAIALDAKYARAHGNLGVALFAQRKVDQAIAELRKAIEIDPEFAPGHHNLGLALKDKKQLDEAIAEFRQAFEIDPNYAAAHSDLGLVLRDKKQLDEAIAEFRKAIAIHPKFALAHNNLGLGLHDKNQLDEAVAEYRTAIELDPEYAAAHNNLGNALQAKNRLDEAITHYRKAIELDASYALAHYNLGNALKARNQLDDAVAEYRKAIELDPEYAPAHNNLGNALLSKNQLDEAIAAYREAIEIDPALAPAHCSLANALLAKNRWDDAISEYHKAIEIDPKYMPAYANLGGTLARQGEFSRAKVNFQRAIDLLAPAAPEREQCIALLQRVDRLIALEARLSDVLAGKHQPADNQERLGFAEVCRYRRRFATATRFCSEAFAADSKLAEDAAAGHRYNAACFASLAADGQGIDAAELKDEERTALRKQALDWLRGDLELRKKLVDSGTPVHRQQVEATLNHWRQDADLSSLREPEALLKLPPDDQAACKQLWAEVATLLEKAGSGK